MARLNESTAPMESIDILKRRFVRQNREIARVNSMQSLRIRSLESEVSHLLAENISLREQVITLGQELERFEAAKLLQDGVYDMKTRLDDKLRELSSLVNELGTLPRRLGKSYDERSDTANQGQARLSGRESTCRETYFGIKSAPEEQGRLPAIQEDKCYPRKTLESEEIQGLTGCGLEICTPQDSEKSSFLPPVINNGDVSPEASPKVSVGMDTPGADEGFDEAVLPPTLERRKRKKPDSCTTSGSPSLSSPTSFTDQHKTGSVHQTGTKRKFITDCSEDNDLIFTGDDDFQYSRPSHSPPKQNKQPVSICGRSLPLREETQLKQDARYHGPPHRKVLKPKNTNLSNTSPNKAHPATVEERDCKKSSNQKNEDENFDAAQPGKEETGRKQHSSNKNLSRYRSNEAEPEEDRIQDTAILDDNTAQKSKQSSSAITVFNIQSENGGAPEVFDAPSRPTRRQRSVVSYAEPNLRDKMRRPTNEFVPAVGVKRSRRPSSTDTTQEITNEGAGGLKNHLIDAKQTHDSPEAFDSSLKKSAGGLAKSSTSLASHRKRKTIPSNNEDADIRQYTTEEVVGAASMFQGTSQNNKSEDSEPGHGDDHVTGAVKPGKTNLHLEIPYLHTASVATESSEAAPGRAKQPRRHSSHPRVFIQDVARKLEPASIAEAGKLSSLDASLEASASAMPVQDANIESTAPDGEEAGSGSGTMDVRRCKRGQRAAARRKSMML